ncbi:protocatechuate 3,4-dioxygenase subunit alpha [Salinisphaera sp. Q1T1-3]|uniref:protocatechuate 3,4-dioxygenase subunit alpha n=1 Tax=Salinisphaera sp. Q1T1-3 TaxID=2321229 RepID=UPI000E70CDA6|nr:protocatechuate 3,4-dioxygenase subunit alpha [Salinisphaera sp. Q1T1-3]RJS91089.1 protocatechuate 3,4-dioxygenase subunit alpha [Salinisphaera sp. Q1T1-3]
MTRHDDYRQPRDPGDVFLPETPSQTAGPYVHIGLALDVAGLPERDHEIDNRLAEPEAEGEFIELAGVVLDGADQPVADILVEAWQADAHGAYVTDFAFDNVFNSFGRAAPGADDAGRWVFSTIKPGRVPYPGAIDMAPHINLALFARGINIHLQTRIYFDDEADDNADCPFLNKVPPHRRDTLIARRAGESDAGHPRYEIVIRLQGPEETVFFDY